MFCSNCGVQASGNFCAACGARLQTPGNVQPPPPVVPLTDWKQEVVYETLIQHPEVRQRLAEAAKRCPKNRFTGEDLLGLYDKLVPTGIPLQKLSTVLLPVFDRMGIKTGKQSQLSIQAPIGHTLVTLLCGMAARGFELQHVDQLPSGCVFTALVPSTLTTNRGELVVSANQHQQAIQIQAAVKISGQLMDFGKSNAILKELFDEVRRELAPQGPPALPGRNVA